MGSHPVTSWTLAAAIALVGGCAGGGSSAGSGGKTVSPDKFGSELRPEPAGPVAVQGPAGPPRVTTIKEVDVQGGVGDVDARSGPPSLVTDAPRPVGEELFVDGVVGELNGKPVRVNEFLGTMADRLLAGSRKDGVTHAEWMSATKEFISGELERRLATEILASEGMASIPPERREGLVTWLQDVHERIRAAQGGGVEGRADRNLKDRVGMDMQQLIDFQKDKTLVDQAMKLYVEPRVRVTKFDIEAYYNANKDKYNLPNLYVFRWISVEKTDTEGVSSMRERLAAGEAFAEVARGRANTFHRDDAGRLTKEWDGAQEEGTFFNTESLNDAARELAPGEWRGPFEVRGSVDWLMLEAIEVRRQSRYEAQLEIEQTLLAQRKALEQEKFVHCLLSKATPVDIDQMTRRLLEIAEKRYYRPLHAEGDGAGDER